MTKAKPGPSGPKPEAKSQEAAGKKVGKAKDEAAEKRDEREVYNVTPEEFVRVWQTSDSADEVSRRLNMPKPIVHARASNYRDKGLQLKKMKRHSNRGLDVQSLNALIAQLNAEQGVAAEPPPPAPPPGADALIEQLKAMLSQAQQAQQAQAKKK